MKILITGTTGMVGQNLLDKLEESEHVVLSPTRKELNLFDKQETLYYLNKMSPDFVIHCAGKVGGIQANIADPLAFFVENLEMGKNLVLAAAKVGVPRLLNLGSSCMYPRHAPNPLVESQILNGELEPTNEGYALAKIAVQRLCVYVMQKYPSLQYKTLVPCNIYGRYDKFDSVKAHLVPAVLRKIHDVKTAQQNTVTIWGDGEARREFLYAGDLANFIVNKLAQFDTWPSLMNVGAGIDYTIKEYYEIACRVVGLKNVVFNYDLQKPAGMRQKLIDVTRQVALNWQPQVSLEQGMKLTYNYFLNTLGLIA